MQGKGGVTTKNKSRIERYYYLHIHEYFYQEYKHLCVLLIE